MDEEPPGVVETHVSQVFFVGDRAYKCKKPVRTAFLDFTTEAARRAACEREVTLNRRLAPDVYLGVATVLGVAGAPCDHLVVMRRLPDAARLSRVALRGDPRPPLAQVAGTLAAFHAAAATSPAIAAHVTAGAVLGRWEANHHEMLALLARPEPVLDAPAWEAVLGQARRYLDGRSRLLGQRILDGRIRDGHGDLLADDIFCLPDGPRIIDCLEFDDRLRYCDTLDDAAFLGMDLERLGGPALGEAWRVAYLAASGDAAAGSLWDHYVAYRAQVRAKVAAIRASQGLAGREEEQEADVLLALAQRHLAAARVRLVLVGGPPGTGKSTLAHHLGRRLGWPVLRSDEIRRGMVDLPAVDLPAVDLPAVDLPAVDLPADGAAFGEGPYAPEVTAAVYRAMLAQARDHLEMGASVVLDATWGDAGLRAEADALAVATASDLVCLRCDLPAPLAAHRIHERSLRGGDLSQASEGIATRMAAVFQPWPSSTAISTEGPPETVLAAALSAVG